MSILSDGEILAAVAAGEIEITPYDPDRVKPLSYDFRVGAGWITRRKTGRPVRLHADVGERGLLVFRQDTFVLYPGQFVLARTLERVRLSAAVGGKIEGRSSVGRQGLQIENAGFVDPGWDGVLTLELRNDDCDPRVIVAGDEIGQLIFWRLTRPALRPYGSVGLGSRYQGAVGVEAAKARVLPGSPLSAESTIDDKVRQSWAEAEQLQRALAEGDKYGWD